VQALERVDHTGPTASADPPRAETDRHATQGRPLTRWGRAVRWNRNDRQPHLNPPLPVGPDSFAFAHSHGALTVRCSGPARGEARPDSDLDLLIGPRAWAKLLDLVAIKTRPGRSARPLRDVVTEGGLFPYLVIGSGGSAAAHGMNAPTQIAYLQHVRDALVSVKSTPPRDGMYSSLRKMVQDAVRAEIWRSFGEAVKSTRAGNAEPCAGDPVASYGRHARPAHSPLFRRGSRRGVASGRSRSGRCS